MDYRMDYSGALSWPLFQPLFSPQRGSLEAELATALMVYPFGVLNGQAAPPHTHSAPLGRSSATMVQRYTIRACRLQTAVRRNQGPGIQRPNRPGPNSNCPGPSTRQPLNNSQCHPLQPISTP